ncbi:Tetratricopeptide-like helical [Cucumis melo var. makuwa]|uniref:Uncharacterized protein LOC103503559 n=2 Tax=Cucumis melo TaxID=3656 RepID=A0A1S3CQ68_CUCME|nr:uncharacterized protein LOC103503559 [Cucumis melo]KAA0038565.1 Tetratricopeptide-like helical [Cucumis melo var. makuwa]TYK31178.1 Tetratricopeptide-like helical [Cucumis melo var. makuwa]
MKSALLRTGSVPLLSPTTTASNNKQPLYGVLSCHNSSASSPRISLHCTRNNSNRIRRAASESDIVRSLHEVSNTSDQFSGLASRSLSRSFPSKIPEEEFIDEDDQFDSDSMEEDKEYLNYRVGVNDRSKIGAYYEHMLKLNPSDALLLRNYGKFLHEVVNDTKRAEECYSRAILASPTDGELLALYGKLVWDTERDKQRAQYYFDRAVYASPNDCLVTGHYAHFMWQVEDDEAALAEDSPAGMVTAC